MTGGTAEGSAVIGISSEAMINQPVSLCNDLGLHPQETFTTLDAFADDVR